MKEFKITYFFDEDHYIRRFVHLDSFEEAKSLVHDERGQYVAFFDSREIYHELDTSNVRVVQISEYHRENKAER
ncbi:hypothetical protein ABZ756_10640 [Mammaliicoccus sciuri]|uniref:Uncharacterized protein n=2 Tax=Sporosarcina newyorkensis TaxID=759851 RepID=A0A1T4Y9K9_9BACL|nr:MULTISPECIES: hypothetical protein [Sporosarcina]EGQ26340.1 hypothetical protein HMPREF9372_1620 [Sporosarcina newyorkensis 2681]MBY0223760.1 hypothetical protein [Sporosarcina aquimarina]SKA98492.1 hypothetical protein SAMN04244570_2089 [Sporosarcina newyorkensis]